MWQQIRERRKTFCKLHEELIDYVMLKNAWGRSGIKVIGTKTEILKYFNGKLIGSFQSDYLFIYGFFWSCSINDRVLLGFNYKEVIERVLRDYS